MRRLAIFFLVLSFVFVNFNNSKQMFSIEQGYVYAESYNLNHILNSSLSADICNTCEKQKDTLTPRNYNHSHIILLNSLAQDKSQFISSYPIPIIFTFPTQHNLHTSIPANTLLVHSELRFLSPPISSILQSTILLI